MLLTAISVQAASVHIGTPGTSLLLDATVGERPGFIYYGPRLSDADIIALDSTEKRHGLYPAYGLITQTPTALEVRHPDGAMTLDPAVTDVLRCVDPQGLPLTEIKMRDRKYPVEVSLKFRTYPGTDVIDEWAEVSNLDRKGELLLTRYASAVLPVRRGDVWLTHLDGSWANEARLNQEPLNPGVKVIADHDGTRNSHTSHAEIMLSLDGRPDGSLIYERHADGTYDEDRHWWVQAECMVGLSYLAVFHAHPECYGEIARVWQYCREYLVDYEEGEWYWSRRADGSVNRDEDKTGFWKCPYHNTRACLETARILRV